MKIEIFMCGKWDTEFPKTTDIVISWSWMAQKNHFLSQQIAIVLDRLSCEVQESLRYNDIFIDVLYKRFSINQSQILVLDSFAAQTGRNHTDNFHN